jgi:hypothetical protein
MTMDGVVRFDQISILIKEQAYKSLISPSHEYLCSAWNNYNESELDEL